MLAKIPEDEYMELLKWCNENGYSSISSCLRGIIESILGRPQRPKMVDIEVDLKELIERINRIEKRLDDVERRLGKVEGLNRWLTGSKHTRKRT